MKAKEKKTEVVDILQVETKTIHVCVLGKTPLIFNRLSEKARHELLFPSRKKNTAEKATTLKHDPLGEFRASLHSTRNDDDPTLITLPATAFKGATRSAAIDLPGATKAQIGRLVYVEREHIHIYGVPKLHMSVIRMKDMNRTPDIRSRAILPEWAAFLSINYVTPMLTQKTVMHLLAAAGMFIGVGDWRPEKGSGNFGRFELVSDTNTAFKNIVQVGGREAQVAAMKRADAYDLDTEDLLRWFDEELDNRGLAVA